MSCRQQNNFQRGPVLENALQANQAAHDIIVAPLFGWLNIAPIF